MLRVHKKSLAAKGPAKRTAVARSRGRFLLVTQTHAITRGDPEAKVILGELHLGTRGKTVAVVRGAVPEHHLSAVAKYVAVRPVSDSRVRDRGLLTLAEDPDSGRVRVVPSDVERPRPQASLPEVVEEIQRFANPGLSKSQLRASSRETAQALQDAGSGIEVVPQSVEVRRWSPA